MNQPANTDAPYHLQSAAGQAFEDALAAYIDSMRAAGSTSAEIAMLVTRLLSLKIGGDLAGLEVDALRRAGVL